MSVYLYRKGEPGLVFVSIIITSIPPSFPPVSRLKLRSSATATMAAEVAALFYLPRRRAGELEQQHGRRPTALTSTLTFPMNLIPHLGIGE